jgi:hypothetical protein
MRKQLLHNIWQLAIFLPLIVVFVILYKKDAVLQQNTAKMPENTNIISPIATTETPSIGNALQNLLSVDKVASAELNLLLSGKKKCSFMVQDATIEASINNGVVYANVTQKKEVSSALIKDNCLYTWQKQKKEGSQICGIDTLYGLSKKLQNIPANLLEGALQKVSPNLTSLPDINAIVKECKEAKTFGGISFALPKNITFKKQEVKLPF